MKNLNLFVVALILFVSCKQTNKNADNQEIEQEVNTHQEEVKKDCSTVHWSHQDGEDGPENWKNLCDGFSDCGSDSQSPIEIVTTNLIVKNTLVTPEFSYGKSKVNIINNGHTVQFNVEGEHEVVLDGKAYQLLQFHYHALSEHMVDGAHFPIEVHFVHKHSDTDFAVLGVMFEKGKENDLFSKYLDKFPISKGTYASDETIDLLGLFPDNKSYYNYSGSLTTPPCSEVVSWYVLKTPVEVSKQQIDMFSTILDSNFRPVMPKNDRDVKLYEE